MSTAAPPEEAGQREGLFCPGQARHTRHWPGSLRSLPAHSAHRQPLPHNRPTGHLAWEGKSPTPALPRTLLPRVCNGDKCILSVSVYWAHIPARYCASLRTWGRAHKSAPAQPHSLGIRSSFHPTTSCLFHTLRNANVCAMHTCAHAPVCALILM